jgi:hypothetical protein
MALDLTILGRPENMQDSTLVNSLRFVLWPRILMFPIPEKNEMHSE